MMSAFVLVECVYEHGCVYVCVWVNVNNIKPLKEYFLGLHWLNELD